MKNYNYNYVFLFYDVGEKRVNKVFKICKKYLTHYQRSVFRGTITPSSIIKIRGELNSIIQENDFICIVKMFGNHVFEEEVLLANGNPGNDLFV